MTEYGSGFALEIQGLVKRYGRSTALREVTLQVAWGERLVLFGPNGSGKTTLIKVLSTLTRPTAGTIRLAGLDLQKNASYLRRLLGVVTHEPFLYQDMTAYENLLFFGRMFTLDDLHNRIHKVSEIMGVERSLQSRVRVLSHGTQKRLSLARALLHNPRILLLDEPETGLDQDGQTRLEDLLQIQPKDLTILMTTHSIDRGLAWGTRVAFLSQGRIVFDEQTDHITTMDLKSKYTKLVEPV